MVPLVVDPQALFAAGSAVGAVGDGLNANLIVLTAGFAAHTGLDAAGEVFGLAYQDTAEQLLKAAAAAINACRQSGALIQQGAANYSKAEAASALGGGAGVLQAPPEPTKIAPPGPPGTWGKGEPPPLLWALVESFVDDVWPDGDVAGLHAAAARWRGFGAAASGTQGALNASKSLFDAQQIPEGGKIDEALSKIGDCMAQLGEQSGKLATSLDAFADEVNQAHNHIRDLLNRLGSLADLGHDVMLIIKGDAIDEIKKIARDINDVLHDLGREARAAEQGMKLGMQVVDGLVVKLEKYTRGELKDFLGDAVGNQVATVFDTWVNANEGVLKGAVGMAQGLVDLDPRWFLLDPKGATATWEGMTKTGLLNHFLNPQEAVEADKQMFKALLHLDDWSTARPGLGFGENVFDVATLFLPGAGEAGAAADGAGAAARGAEAAEAAGAAGRAGERAAGGFGEIVGARGALADISKTSGDLTKNLEGIAGNLPKIDPPLGGQPVGLPPGKLSEVPVGPVARPPDIPPGAPHGPAAAPGPTPLEPPGPGGGPCAVPPAPAGGPHEPPEPAGAVSAPGGAGSGGPHEPGPEPAPATAAPPAGGPHEPAAGPHEPVSVPVGSPHEPIPATAPASAPTAVPAAAGERLPSAIPQVAEPAPVRVPVAPSGSPIESAPVAAHSPQSAPSFSSAAPHSTPPGGRPTDLPPPDGSGRHGPGDGGPPGGRLHGKPPHDGGSHGNGDGGPPGGDNPHGPSDGRPSSHPPGEVSPNQHGSPSGDDGVTGETPDGPDSVHGPPTSTKLPGIDYSLPAADALRLLEHPGAELERLVNGGVPQELLDGYEPLAGRTPEEFEREFTIKGPNGDIRWDWDVQAPNNGFAGEPMTTDRIPTNLRLDRLGPNGGGFLSPEGIPLPQRATPPGLTTQYHIFEGTGEPIPQGKNWEVQFGPAKDAFGQPGGGEQWVVVDKATNSPISVDDLKDAGMLSEHEPIEDAAPQPNPDEPDEPN